MSSYHGCLSFCGSPCWTLRSIRGLLALRAAQVTAPFAPRPRKTMHRIVFSSGLRVQPHRVQPNSSATPLGGAAVWLPLLDSPLNPRPACPPGCAGNRSFRSPAPENDALHRFLLGASSPTPSGTAKQERHPFGWRSCLAPPVGLEPTTLRLTAACSTD